MLIEFGQFIAVTGLIISGLVALWNVHKSSIEQAAKLKEIELNAKNSEKRTEENAKRIFKLEERNDDIVEIKTEVKHMSKRIEELVSRTEDK